MTEIFATHRLNKPCQYGFIPRMRRFGPVPVFQIDRQILIDQVINDPVRLLLPRIFPLQSNLLLPPRHFFLYRALVQGAGICFNYFFFACCSEPNMPLTTPPPIRYSHYSSSTSICTLYTLICSSRA